MCINHTNPFPLHILEVNITSTVCYGTKKCKNTIMMTKNYINNCHDLHYLYFPTHRKIRCQPLFGKSTLTKPE